MNTPRPQFEGRRVTDRVDVFAYGVLLWECLARRQPWRDLSAMQIIFAVGIQARACRGGGVFSAAASCGVEC